MPRMEANKSNRGQTVQITRIFIDKVDFDVLDETKGMLETPWDSQEMTGSCGDKWFSPAGHPCSTSRTTTRMQKMLFEQLPVLRCKHKPYHNRSISTEEMSADLDMT